MILDRRQLIAYASALRSIKDTVVAKGQHEYAEGCRPGGSIAIRFNSSKTFMPQVRERLRELARDPLLSTDEEHSQTISILFACLDAVMRLSKQSLGGNTTITELQLVEPINRELASLKHVVIDVLSSVDPDRARELINEGRQCFAEGFLTGRELHWGRKIELGRFNGRKEDTDEDWVTLLTEAGK